jgi:hypothetical protein
MKPTQLVAAALATLFLTACGDDVVVKSPDDHDHHEEAAEADADRAADKADRAADKAEDAAEDAAAAKDKAD